MTIGFVKFMMLIVLISPSLWSAVDGSGLKTGVAIDMVGKAGQAGPGTADRFDVREAELSLYAPVDHLFDGTLTAAAHQEDTGAFFEIHEAFFSSSKLIPRSRFRLGQFFLSIGRLNQFHRHDWPFVSAPRAHREFFSDEGLTDTGLEYSYLFPTPFYLDLTAGITNGWTFGHSHDQGAKPQMPTHYLHLVHYLDLPWNGGTQWGLNYVGRKANDGTQTTIAGLDLTAKWRESNYLHFLFQSEIWHRWVTASGPSSQRNLGLYVYPQYGLDTFWALGCRADYFSDLSLKDALDRDVTNYEFSLVPTVTYRASEFSTLRLAFTWQANKMGSETTQQHAVELQATFILGAHPAHDF